MYEIRKKYDRDTTYNISKTILLTCYTNMIYETCYKFVSSFEFAWKKKEKEDRTLLCMISFVVKCALICEKVVRIFFFLVLII